MINLFNARSFGSRILQKLARPSKRAQRRRWQASEQLESRQLLTMAFAVTDTNELLRFDTATPNSTVTIGTISGLQQGEQIAGIDFRPATSELYALGVTAGSTDSGRVYTLSLSTAAATQVGTSPFSTSLQTGADYGFDFNPVPDRIRIVNDAEQNFRAVPTTGALAATDSFLAYATGDANVGDDPIIVGSAYSNAVGGASFTTLYSIDFNSGETGQARLVRQGGVDGSPSPNLGALNTVNPLGVTLSTADVGFDIDGHDGRAYASLNVGGTTRLYQIHLTNGTATAINTIGDGTFAVRGLAILTPTAPNTATIYAVNTSNELISFRANTPGTTTTIGTISGLQAGEVIKGIDFRPTTNTLYALGITDESGTDVSRVYTVNTSTAAATIVGTTASTALSDLSNYGFDFNPVPDRIRVNNTDDQNIRLNPITGGTAATDTALAYNATDANVGANPSVVGAAYTQSQSGATSTTLYVIDSALNILARQGDPDSAPTSPNAGVLNTVGGLGITLTSPNAGFDLRSGTGTAYAALTTSSGTALYQLNVTGSSNIATSVGAIGTGSSEIVGLAVAPEVSLEIFLDSAGATVTVDVSGGNLRVRSGTTDLLTPTAASGVTSLRIFGGEGNDSVTLDASLVGAFTGSIGITTNGGTDTIIGGTVTTGLTISTGDGADIVVDGLGNDTISSGNGNDTIIAAGGNDSVIAGEGNDLVRGNAGNDTIEGSGGDDVVLGAAGNDKLRGGDGNDSMLGEAGNDTLDGGAGNDSLNGGVGNDTVAGGAGNDSMLGDSGFDVLIGQDGDDVIDGGAANDTILGGAGNDSIIGGSGNDQILGEAGFDTVIGAGGDDIIDGGADNDALYGSGGNDTINGNTGTDATGGGSGTNTVTADGVDLFTFDLTPVLAVL